jgi:hypothetical protein
VALRFAFLSRFGMKFVEVGGAGVASALCAYFLGQINQPSAPPPPPPIVQVMPASEDALRMARDENALLAALVRKEADSQAKTESAPATPAAGSAVAAKPAKPAQAEPARRSQKPAQAAQAESQPRAAEPLPIQAPLSATASAPAPARPASESLVARDEGDGPLLTRIKQIPSWFLPENDRIFGEVPRPPMPVGELLSLPLKATAMIR